MEEKIHIMPFILYDLRRCYCKECITHTAAAAATVAADAFFFYTRSLLL
jgi:hypothetical protein